MDPPDSEISPHDESKILLQPSHVQLGVGIQAQSSSIHGEAPGRDAAAVAAAFGDDVLS